MRANMKILIPLLGLAWVIGMVITAILRHFGLDLWVSCGIGFLVCIPMGLLIGRLHLI